MLRVCPGIARRHDLSPVDGDLVEVNAADLLLAKAYASSGALYG
jgi:hypothetical protein